MRRAAVGIAAALTLGFAGPGLAESEFDEIQESEQPGSEINIEFGRGGVQVQRENGAPLFPVAPYAGAAPANQPIFPVAPLTTGPGGSQLAPLDDPDTPVAGDPIDRELPGEGPQDLSGPFDEDPLPE
jgi:hypothetical protein